jgi:hypothetical protein
MFDIVHDRYISITVAISSIVSLRNVTRRVNTRVLLLPFSELKSPVSLSFDLHIRSEASSSDQPYHIRPINSLAHRCKGVH